MSVGLKRKYLIRRLELKNIIAQRYKMEIKESYLACAHCGQTGTCNNGNDLMSCIKCSREAKNIFGKFFCKPAKGVICSVCKGYGVVEPYTFSLNNRIRPALASGIIVGAIVILPAALGTEHFDAILAFSTTITGAVTGFYFGGTGGKK